MDSAPRVTVESGTLEGARFGTKPEEVMFLGIPFAEPPTGDRRWKPPQPVQKWHGVRQANSFGPGCPQSPSFWAAAVEDAAKTFPYYTKLRTDEDCLSLNVWTANQSSTEKRAVMFWIHGGGFVNGTSQLPAWGPALARKGVVFVSTNYRLGALGFLAHPALTAESPHHASGNFAILDLIAALEWVQRNIAQFGGDPSRVTIIGQSSGGAAVCYLMASPLARDLFHGSILESGTCRDYISPELKRSIPYEGGTGTSEQIGLSLARDLGISDGPGTLAKLRAKTPDEILHASEQDANMSFNGTVDGWVLAEQPALTFSNGRQAKVPVIVGSNSDEETILFDMEHGPTTLVKYKAWLQDEFSSAADEVFHMYPAATDADVRSAFIRMSTDYGYGNGAHLVAEDTARVGQKAYFYYFTYPAKGKDAGLGARHGFELSFIGGVFSKSRFGEPDADDRKLSDIMMGYWTQFAATGNPNLPGLHEWPAYDPKTDQCLEVGREVKLRSTPHLDHYTVFERIFKDRLATAEKNPH